MSICCISTSKLLFNKTIDHLDFATETSTNLIAIAVMDDPLALVDPVVIPAMISLSPGIKYYRRVLSKFFSFKYAILLCFMIFTISIHKMEIIKTADCAMAEIDSIPFQISLCPTNADFTTLNIIITTLNRTLLSALVACVQSRLNNESSFIHEVPTL